MFVYDVLIATIALNGLAGAVEWHRGRMGVDASMDRCSLLLSQYKTKPSQTASHYCQFLPFIQGETHNTNEGGPRHMFSGKLARLDARALSTVVGLVSLCCLAKPSNAQTITSNQTGSNNGFFYSYYRSGGSGTMTLGSAGNYALSWSGVSDIVVGKGWNPGSRNPIGYNCGAYSNSGGGSQGIYGWTTSPLVEYYIQENGSATAGTFEGTVSSDGGTYNIWEHQQVNQPSIIGTATFEQYISARTSSRGTGQNDTVTVANHFNAWASHGMNLGTFNYQILYVESFSGGSGYCNQTVWAE
jgi:endo-1,4-beta-xylanase